MNYLNYNISLIKKTKTFLNIGKLIDSSDDDDEKRHVQIKDKKINLDI